MTAGEPVVAGRACPHCASPLGADDLFCEQCGFDLQSGRPIGAGDLPSPEPVAPGAVAPGAVALGAVGRAVPRAGEEIGGVDADSVQFDAAVGCSGPPRRPGVVVPDVDLDAAVTACPSCPGAIAADGYCEQCGNPGPRPRDHWVDRPASWVALVCDRGRRHAINQDGAAVGAAPEPGSFAAMVVCDGVSSAARSELASLAGARAARDALVAPSVIALPAMVHPEPATPLGSSAAPSQASVLGAAMREAGAAAQERAVAAASSPPERNPPACTFAAAVLDGPVLVAGWVGDSRVYWLPDDGVPLQLSDDDSLAGEAIRQGLPREAAERSPHAHSITRWLGLDAPDPQPHTAVRRVDAPAWVLVCSDGLWNYCSEASAMRDLVRQAAGRAGHDVGVTAETLVAWANEQGGHDNISVVLARVGEAPG